MPPRRTSYRSRNPKRQTRLQFSSLPASSPDKKEYSTAVQDRLSCVTYQGARSSPGPRINSTPDSPSQPMGNEHSDESSPLSEAPPTAPTSSIPQQSIDDDDGDDDDDDDELVTPAAKRRKTRRQETTTLSTPLRRSARIDNPSSPTRTNSSRSSRFSHIEIPSSPSSPKPTSDIGEAESTDDEAAALLASAPMKTRRGKAPANASYFEPRTRDRAPQVASHTYNEDDWLVEDDEVEYISSDDEDIVTEPARHQKTARSARRKSRKEQEELEADLEDLRDSDAAESEDEEPSSKMRTRGGPVTTQRDEAREHFDLLRRRRAGEKIPRIEDSDDESEHGQDISYIGRPSQVLSDAGSVHSSVDTEPDDEEAPAPAEDVDDFIEEDEEEQPGALRRPRSDIPLEFTPWMIAKPRELFPHIVEWLVKNKIAPAFQRDDPIFRLAFQRVSDQVAAQAGSRLISSAWNAEFKYTILARPQIAIGFMPGMDEDHIRTCDACNKTNRPAKYDLVLTGSAYNMDTLELIEKDSDAEDEEADDDSVDAKGRILASEDRHFYLGSHCAANAQMGHKLTHWKYHLNETILKYLEEQGILSAEAIVAREKKNKRKREKEAEAIVDSMGETGNIDELWALFQRDLKDAMLGMTDYNVRGGRSQGRIGVIRTRGEDGRTRVWNGDKYSEHITLSDSD